MFHHKLITAVTVLSLSFCGNTAFAKTILFVPQDDRPVSFAYTVSTAEKAGYTVLTPPKAFLSSKSYQGLPERIWTWIDQNIDQADVAILSTDTLIYGGLVDSRKHNEDLKTLQYRENKIRNLHISHPNIPLYAFGTIMRTPYASSGGVEPYYYSDYGTDIYRIAALQDKQDTNSITAEETAELLSLKLTVPTEYLQDWFRRRTKNNLINKQLLKDAKNGVFAYFCEGHDDNSKNSQTNMEARYQEKDTTTLKNNIFGSFPGADQLALLLIARYHVESNKLHPTFGILYPLGRGEDTIPSYENQPIGKTIAEHIHAVGGSISQKQSPDIMLAVNTPLLSTGESGQFSNFGMMKQSTTDFITQIKSTIDRGISLSIVDVYFANGSDNTLMNLIVKNNLLYKVSSYNGWNTASNTIGYAIAQAILAPYMTPQDHKNMLTEQYIDNWAYQANVRKDIIRFAESKHTKGKITPEVKEEMIASLQDFAKKKLNLNPRTISADFPWNRFFEIDALVSNTPKYPLYLTAAEKYRRFEEEQKKKAAEEKSKKESAAKGKNGLLKKNTISNDSEKMLHKLSFIN